MICSLMQIVGFWWRQKRWEGSMSRAQVLERRRAREAKEAAAAAAAAAASQAQDES